MSELKVQILKSDNVEQSNNDRAGEIVLQDLTLRCRHSVQEVPIEPKSCFDRVSDQVVKKAEELCQMAHDYRAKGDRLKAFDAFVMAAEAGSYEAKFWLGDVKLLVPASERPFIQKPPISIIEKSDICQNVILQKWVGILKGLQQNNSKAYDLETIQKIEKDLSEGHCNGFSFDFIRLAFSRNLVADYDCTEEYFTLMQRMVTSQSETFEPPEKFSYKRYAQGDDQKLSKEEKERLAFTNEAKEFIQSIRFAQQNLHDKNEWGWNRRTAITSDQFNVHDILGNKYQESLRISTRTPYGEVGLLIAAIQANLTEENAIKLHFPTEIGGGHVTAIIYREGKYYFFDPNNTSLEENYDPRYSALLFDSIEKLELEIKKVYQRSVPENKRYAYGGDQTNLKGLCTAQVIDREGVKTNYLNWPDVIDRLNYVTLRLLSQRLASDEFHRLLEPDQSSIDSKTMKSLFDKDPDVFRLFRVEGILDHIKTIDIGALDLDEESYMSLMIATPRATLSPQSETLMKAQFKLANYFENRGIAGDEAKALYQYERVADQGHLEARYRLGNYFKTRNQDEAINHYTIAADQGHVGSCFALASLYEDRNNPEKVIQYYLRAAEVDFAEAHVRLGGFMEDEFPADKDKAIYHYRLSADQGNITARNRLRSLFMTSLRRQPDQQSRFALADCIYLYFPKTVSLFVMELFRLAADEGHQEAQFRLGVIYLDGIETVSKDLGKAKHYLGLAAHQGHKEASLKLETLDS